MKMVLKKYWESLKRHPGVPIVCFLMVLGFLAGVKRDNTISSGFIGMAIMGIFWVPVLITAWQMHNDS